MLSSAVTLTLHHRQPALYTPSTLSVHTLCVQKPSTSPSPSTTSALVHKNTRVPLPLGSLFHSLALFCTGAKRIFFPLNHFRTLSVFTRDGVQSGRSHFGIRLSSEPSVHWSLPRTNQQNGASILPAPLASEALWPLL